MKGPATVTFSILRGHYACVEEAGISWPEHEFRVLHPFRPSKHRPGRVRPRHDGVLRNHKGEARD
jgi:hypothetical protein